MTAITTSRVITPVKPMLRWLWRRRRSHTSTSSPSVSRANQPTLTPKDQEGEIADWDVVVYVTQRPLVGSDACVDGGEVGFTETLDTLLDPGIYYLVIDGPG